MNVEPRPVADIAKARAWVFHGRSGTGKTTLFATFRKRSLLIDIRDQGTDSISDESRIERVEVNEWKDLEEVYWWLKAKDRGYRTIGIDTCTQMQDLAILQHLKKQGRSVRRVKDWGALSQRGWGQVTGLMKEWVTNFRDLSLPVESGGLGVDVIFLAQERVFGVDGEREEGVDSTLDPEVGPRLSPSVVSHLNAVCSVIGSTAVRRRERKTKDERGRTRFEPVTEYILRIGPNPYYVTKIRKPKSVVVPEVIVDPSYSKLMAIIKGDR